MTKTKTKTFEELYKNLEKISDKTSKPKIIKGKGAVSSQIQINKFYIMINAWKFGISYNIDLKDYWITFCIDKMQSSICPTTKDPDKILNLIKCLKNMEEKAK